MKLRSDKLTYRPCSVVWEHPSSGGQLFIANEHSATSRDILLEHQVGFIATRLSLVQLAGGVVERT